MLKTKKLFFQIEQNIEAILEGTSKLGKNLWKFLISQHPSDVAILVAKLDEHQQVTLFKKLPLDLSIEIFEKLPEEIHATVVIKLDTERATNILQQMPPYKVCDLLEHLSDEDFKTYFTLLQGQHRKRVHSLLKFDPESAGGIMKIDVLTLDESLTIKQSISLLQRVQPKREHLYQRIFVTDKNNELIGYIYLDSLVVNKPETPLKNILQENELIINVNEDQEKVAEQMRHYDLVVAPVIDDKKQFLGIITADEIFDIFKEEASEDVHKFAALTPVERTYFQTSFWRLIWQRGPWLISLLFLQSISSFILSRYDAMLVQYTIIPIFLTMLIGTGGNAGNQSGALVVRGLATGEIGRKNAIRLLLREFRVAIIISLILGIAAFGRVLVHPTADIISASAISASLFLIVVTATMLGTFLPLLLERFNFDPAYSAAPFLATIMDIIGVIIYCLISSWLLG